jgi:membrane protease YdiL (CAAX protease family)
MNVLGTDLPSWVAGDLVPILVIFVPLALCGGAGDRWFGAGRIAAGPRPLLHLIFGLIIGAAGFAAALAITAAYGVVQTGIKPWPMTGISLIAGTLAFFVQTAAEELFFRGWVQGAISRFWGAWPAILTAFGRCADHTAFASKRFSGGHVFWQPLPLYWRDSCTNRGALRLELGRSHLVWFVA